MGLYVNVYRSERSGTWLGGNDCTNGGISSRARELVMMNVDGPFDWKREAEYPAAMLVPNFCFGDYDGRRLVKVVPAELVDGEWKPILGGMFGGNYAADSDSRFGEAVAKLLKVEFWSGAVPIHDRFE